jgi:phage nucleotide-binding protein
MSTAEVLTTKTLGGLSVSAVEDLPSYINMLVYGDPGVGKTVLAGSASQVDQLGPVLYVDVEGGTLSLRERYPDVDVVRIKSFDDLGALFEALRKGDSGYKTIVLDSITEIQKFGMYSIMKRALQNDPDRDPDLPGIGEWGKNTEQMRRLIRAFRDLPMNCIFIALAAVDQDKKGNKLIKPALSQKLSNEIAGFLDIVVYFYKKEVEGAITRLLLTQGTDEVIAKDRTDRLPPVVEDPDMNKIYQILFSS